MYRGRIELDKKCSYCARLAMGAVSFTAPVNGKGLGLLLNVAVPGS